MLYYIGEFLHINIFHYITVRAILAFFISFFTTIILFPKFIKWAKNKATQPIYDLAPQNHQKKSNTPTMGGIVFISSAIFSVLLTCKFNFFTFITIITIISFLVLGLIDDYSKIKGNSNQEGLSPKKKLLIQIVLSFFISLLLYYNFDTNLYLPFIKHPVIDMKIFAIIFWMIVIISASNAVNLTDGLDGLATVPSIFSLFSFAILLYITGNAVFSRYLFWPFELGVGEVSIIALSLIGALLGFLWYNANPAEVFMGDSGSLTIGATLGVMSILTKSEILLILIGFVFVIEALSVIIQVGSFKTRGKRVFKMAPIHHHFELIGWEENKVTIRFWIIALITNILAILTIKIR